MRGDDVPRSAPSGGPPVVVVVVVAPGSEPDSDGAEVPKGSFADFAAVGRSLQRHRLHEGRK